VRSAHKFKTGEITVKKITLIIALAIVFNLGVLADGEQGTGTRSCVSTPTQPCRNFVQPPTEEPVYVKILEFLKAIF
jgi:hypothetical protein